MKTNVLFVIPSLGVGGAEKSLVELLNQLNYDDYHVDLLLFRTTGIFTNQINKKVNIIKLDEIEELLMFNGKKSIKNLIKRKKYYFVFKKIIISIIFKIFGKFINDSSLFWSNFHKYFKINKKEYDVAIAYLQGICAYYTIDKTIAKKKILWMHTDYGKYSKNSKHDKNYNGKFQEVVTVSKSACNDFIEHHPKMEKHVHVIHNIIDTQSIIELSKEPNEINNDQINIVSVGRLHYAKGFDLVIPALKQLINDGFNIKWYVVGEGKERQNLNKIINENNLVDYCYLLGAKVNPYSYINSADIYLQSSRYEGYCITLAEARTLCKPIVSTDFLGANEQLKHLKTGLIVKCNTENIYHGLKKLIEDEVFRNTLIKNLAEESTENRNEILKVYDLIGKKNN